MSVHILLDTLFFRASLSIGDQQRLLVVPPRRSLLPGDTVFLRDGDGNLTWVADVLWTGEAVSPDVWLDGPGELVRYAFIGWLARIHPGVVPSGTAKLQAHWVTLNSRTLPGALPWWEEGLIVYHSTMRLVEGIITHQELQRGAALGCLTQHASGHWVIPHGEARKRLLVQVRGVELRCALCGTPIPTLDEATQDHIIPVSQGGPDALANVQLAHRVCNEIKGNALPEQYPPFFAPPADGYARAGDRNGHRNGRGRRNHRNLRKPEFGLPAVAAASLAASSLVGLPAAVGAPTPVPGGLDEAGPERRPQPLSNGHAPRSADPAQVGRPDGQRATGAGRPGGPAGQPAAGAPPRSGAHGAPAERPGTGEEQAVAAERRPQAPAAGRAGGREAAAADHRRKPGHDQRPGRVAEVRPQGDARAQGDSRQRGRWEERPSAGAAAAALMPAAPGLPATSAAAEPEMVAPSPIAALPAEVPTGPASGGHEAHSEVPAPALAEVAEQPRRDPALAESQRAEAAPAPAAEAAEAPTVETSTAAPVGGLVEPEVSGEESGVLASPGEPVGDAAAWTVPSTEPEGPVAPASDQPLPAVSPAVPPVPAAEALAEPVAAGSDGRAAEPTVEAVSEAWLQEICQLGWSALVARANQRDWAAKTAGLRTLEQLRRNQALSARVEGVVVSEHEGPEGRFTLLNWQGQMVLVEERGRRQTSYAVRMLRALTPETYTWYLSRFGRMTPFAAAMGLLGLWKQGERAGDDRVWVRKEDLRLWMRVADDRLHAGEETADEQVA